MLACDSLTIDRRAVQEIITRESWNAEVYKMVESWSQRAAEQHGTEIPYHDREFQRITSLLRRAAEATLPQPQPKMGRGGRPLWTAALSRIEAERKALTTMIRAWKAVQKGGTKGTDVAAEMLQLTNASTRWATEWEVAQGKVDGEGVHRRGRFKMQSIPETIESVQPVWTY